ncbi:MAG: hypothetical protein WCP12_02540 [bacterium]
MQTINVRSLLWLLFLRDWPWKLLSLAIALMIYFSVRSQISNLKTLAVPVMGDGGYVVASDKPLTVHVTLRGSETELSQLYTPAIYVAVAPHEKLGAAKETNKIETIQLKSSAIRQIGRLRVVRIDPSFVNVQFERPTHVDTLTNQPPSN